MMIDSHTHYDDSSFDGDRDELLKSLLENDIQLVINIGACMATSKSTVALAEKHPFVFGVVGVHPHSAKDMIETDFDLLREYSKLPKVVAIGEIGLDYYYDTSPREIQRERFIEQLKLASEVDLPVVIHSRDADQETFDIIKQSRIRKGVIHCYSGSAEMAKEYVKLGFYIGVGGVVTYNNARKLIETVEEISIDRILLETDCPYLSPVPHRGKRNSSINLKYVAKKIAEIKNFSLENVEKSTFDNTLRLFTKIFIA